MNPASIEPYEGMFYVVHNYYTNARRVVARCTTLESAKSVVRLYATEFLTRKDPHCG